MQIFCKFSIKPNHFSFFFKDFIYLSVKSISSKALFNATISLLIFFLENLCIFDSEVLKSPTIIVLLSISFLKLFSKIFFMYLGAPMLGAYIFTMFMSSWWTLPLSFMKWPSGSLFMAPPFFWHQSLTELVWWRCIPLDFFCLGSSLFGLPF